MSKEISKWADQAMFESEDMPEGHNAKADPPRVYFLQGTPDPLGSIAAFSAMYSGKVVRDKADVTNDERIHHLEEMKKTKLKAPLEAVNLHFMIDGVHRGITHQIVRQRTAVFAQESLRFAVVDDVSERVALPPSLAGTAEPTIDELTLFAMDKDDLPMAVRNQKQRWRTAWESLMLYVDEVYNYLVNDGMPQEDARGALPHNITTRLNYATNLRNLQDHAGMRLCTQAQFEWRAIWAGIIQSMSNYCTNPEENHWPRGHDHSDQCDNWQWREIANLFRPVCYLTGKCEFGAEVDRKCSIRARVQANHDIGRPSHIWHEAVGFKRPQDEAVNGVVREGMGTPDDRPVFIGSIHPAEWMFDPEAAR